jgi:hypothetical protein
VQKYINNDVRAYQYSKEVADKVRVIYYSQVDSSGLGLFNRVMIRVI